MGKETSDFRLQMRTHNNMSSNCNLISLNQQLIKNRKTGIHLFALGYPLLAYSQGNAGFAQFRLQSNWVDWIVSDNPKAKLDS
jgi:hypothetical protein